MRVIVAEVNNTFGQHHHYVLTDPEGGAINSGASMTCDKVFHVSPFCPVKGRYQFDYVVNQKVTRMSIDYYDDEAMSEPLIHTAIATESQAFGTRALLAAVLRMPLMTFGVMVRIHWHALKLWRRGAKFHRLPDLPTKKSRPIRDLHDERQRMHHKTTARASYRWPHAVLWQCCLT